MNALHEANQYRSIRAKCLPLFGLAEGWSPDVQESIYRTMVCHIAATLGVTASDEDLNVKDPLWWRHRTVDWNAVVDSRTTALTEYEPQIRYDKGMWGFEVSPTFAGASVPGPVGTEREWLGWS